MFGLLVSFVSGIVVIIVAELVALYFAWNWLLKKTNKGSQKAPSDPDPQQSLSFCYKKQGVIWILEPEKVPKVWFEDKVSKEQKSRKEIVEVFPVKKHAKLGDKSLILKDQDGSETTIRLMGCTISSVSATNLATRKWSKRYPIKVESRNYVIYNGSQTCYLYFETSWEKESWSKALRLASSVDSERQNWYAKMSKEFGDYLTSLNSGYPSFMKPSTGVIREPTDRSTRLDGPSSKVRLFLKKLGKKSNKTGIDNKAGVTSSSIREERRTGEKSRSAHDLLSAPASVKPISIEKATNGHLDEDTAQSLPSAFSHSGSQSQFSVNSDADVDDKFASDEGAVCWNLLMLRLFFDAKRNTDLKSAIQAQIQRTLSNMRTPSYIGGVTCTGLDVGSLPPYIHSMRVLPMDMNEVWAMEMDIEYSGGAVLDIETRLEVREPEFEKGIVNSSLDSSPSEEATSGILEGFEHFGNQLKLSGEVSGEVSDEIEIRDEGDSKIDGIKKSSSWKSAYVSRWKSIVTSIANQVSQVPITLAVKVESVRGTLCLHVKPPPSDRLWFSFTSMPDIDFSLDSTVGDHKVTNGHVALLLGNRFKEAIRDTMVQPNCEYMGIPWMLAEKDDWVPRKAAPFIWIRREVSHDQMAETISNSQPGEVKTTSEATKVSKQASNIHLDHKHEKTKNVAIVEKPTHEHTEELASSEPLLASSTSTCLLTGSQSLKDLRVPLLSNEPHDNNNKSISASPDYQPTFRTVSERQIPNGGDTSPKKPGRKARMMDLGKKMGEKLEEKRRHLEEKRRNIVEKMRGP